MHQKESVFSNLSPIVAVGIGPGDPELITVKGLKALQQADVIFYPASKKSGDAEQSFSKKIIDCYGLKGDLKPLLFPMTGKNRSAFYREAYETILQARNAGKRVVVVSEGDVLFYSTFGYLLELANAGGVPCELIPGIPAFIHGGAEMKQPLVDGRETLGILPRPESFDQVRQRLDTTDVLVVMKMSVLKDWGSFLATCTRPFFYSEKLGTAEQFVSSSADEIGGRIIPYFSIIIFKK